jgi:hypothetical protein
VFVICRKLQRLVVGVDWFVSFPGGCIPDVSLSSNVYSYVLVVAIKCRIYILLIIVPVYILFIWML